MVGWHHQLNRHEFEQAPGDGEGQRSLACCSPQMRKEPDTTERLSNNNMELRLIQRENKRKSFLGGDGFHVVSTKPVWHFGPWLQTFHPLLSSAFIDHLFLCQGMLVPQDAVVSKKDMVSNPKEVYNKVQFLKIKFSWPSISTFAIYLLHHKIRILDCGLGWL